MWSWGRNVRARAAALQLDEVTLGCTSTGCCARCLAAYRRGVRGGPSPGYPRARRPSIFRGGATLRLSMSSLS